MPRRTLKDLRILGNARKKRESGERVKLDLPATWSEKKFQEGVSTRRIEEIREDPKKERKKSREHWEWMSSRTDRLEKHGWIENSHNDAGEGVFADLTDEGERIYKCWRHLNFDSDAISEVLDEEGVPGFIEGCKEGRYYPEE